MTVHALKTLPQFFKHAGYAKTFEIRRDDRDFSIGDTLWLQEWDDKNGYTGFDKKFKVSYILRGAEWGIKDGYCIMGLKKLTLARDFDVPRQEEKA